MPVRTTETADAESDAAGKPTRSAGRGPRSRQRGFGRQATLGFIDALQNRDLFARRGDVYVLTGTRLSLAECLGISRQALAGRLTRLERSGVVLGRDPLRIDMERLVRVCFGRRATDSPEPLRADPGVSAPVSEHSAAYERIKACNCSERGSEQGGEPDDTLVNFCYAIKSLLSTFDSLIDCLINNKNQSNQSSSSEQMLTHPDQMLSSGTKSARARDGREQMLTHQMLTDQKLTDQKLSPHAAPPKEEDKKEEEEPRRSRRHDEIPPADRDFGSDWETMTRSRFDELAERWVRSWPSDAAAALALPATSVLYDTCSRYPEEWCRRAMAMITKDIRSAGKIRNPGAILYTAARHGRLSYFPEHPPVFCDHCEDGVLASSFEKSCHECAPRLSEEEAERRKSAAGSAKPAVNSKISALIETEREAVAACAVILKKYNAKYGGNVPLDYEKAKEESQAGRPRSEWQIPMAIGEAYYKDLELNRIAHDRQITLIMSNLPCDDDPYGFGEGDVPHAMIELFDELEYLEETAAPPPDLRGGVNADMDPVYPCGGAVGTGPPAARETATIEDDGDLASVGSVMRRFIATITAPRPGDPDDTDESGSASYERSEERSDPPVGGGSDPPGG